MRSTQTLVAEQAQPTLAFVLGFYSSHPCIISSTAASKVAVSNCGGDFEKQSLTTCQPSTR